MNLALTILAWIAIGWAALSILCALYGIYRLLKGK